MSEWISVADKVPERFGVGVCSLPVFGLVNTGNCFGDLTRAIVVYHPNAKPFWKLATFDDMPLAKNLRGKVEVIAWQELPPFPKDTRELRAKAPRFIG
jgi:hypothetical protein